MTDSKSFQYNPTQPYVTTNPHLNNPLKGVSLDVMGSACAQQLLLKSFSGGSKNRKTKNRKTRNRKTKNRKTKNRKTKNKKTKNRKTKNRKTKNRKNKKNRNRKTINKKFLLKGGAGTCAPTCNVTGQHFVEDADKGALIPPTGYALAKYGSGPDWGYKPTGADGQPTSFVDHHLQTMGTQGIAVNQTKGLLSNYLLENVNAGHCQEGQPESS